MRLLNTGSKLATELLVVEYIQNVRLSGSYDHGKLFPRSAGTYPSKKGYPV